MQKPKNDLQEKQERAEKTRRKFYAAKREKMVRRRTGLSRKNQQLILDNLPMALLNSEIVKERWIFKSAIDHSGYRTGRGRRYHFMLMRYTFQSPDGRRWTAMQAQAHDGDHGWMLNITGLWGLKPA